MTNIQIVQVASDHQDLADLIQQLDTDLLRRYPAEEIFGIDFDDPSVEAVLFVIAYENENENAVGCGAIRPLDDTSTELKRFFVVEEYRNKGIAKSLLEHLETKARESAFSSIKLEAGAQQPEALSFYQKHGYVQIDRFGEYADSESSLCYEKQLYGRMEQLNDKMLIDVHPATVEDASIILELWQGSARWLQSKGINQWHPDYFSLEQVYEWFDNGAEIYLAHVNEVIVGTLLISWSDPFNWGELDDDDSGYIHRFAVNRSFVGAGIGAQLLTWAENQIIRSGKRKIRLDCMAANATLNQYYRKQGYSYVGNKQWDKWSANLYEKKE